MLRIRGYTQAGPALARLSAGRRVCRKYRKAYIRKLQQQEYDKLCRMVPSLAGKQRNKRVSKIKVIEATIQYIDQLHHALAERLQGGGPATSVMDEQVAKATNRLFSEKRTRTISARGENLHGGSTVVCERERAIPSYLLQSDALARHLE